MHVLTESICDQGCEAYGGDSVSGGNMSKALKILVFASCFAELLMLVYGMAVGFGAGSF